MGDMMPRKFRCPGCGGSGPYRTTLAIEAMLTSEGEIQVGDMAEIRSDNPAECGKCGFAGTLDDFDASSPVPF